MPKGVARLGEPTLQIGVTGPVGPSHHHGVVLEDHHTAPKVGSSVALGVEDVIPNDGSVGGARILSEHQTGVGSADDGVIRTVIREPAERQVGVAGAGIGVQHTEGLDGNEAIAEPLEHAERGQRTRECRTPHLHRVVIAQRYCHDASSKSTARTGLASAPSIRSGSATNVYTPSSTWSSTMPSRIARSCAATIA